jgi:hypothetical protein
MRTQPLHSQRPKGPTLAIPLSSPPARPRQSLSPPGGCTVRRQPTIHHPTACSAMPTPCAQPGPATLHQEISPAVGGCWSEQKGTDGRLTWQPVVLGQRKSHLAPPSLPLPPLPLLPPPLGTVALIGGLRRGVLGKRHPADHSQADSSSSDPTEGSHASTHAKTRKHVFHQTCISSPQISHMPLPLASTHRLAQWRCAPARSPLQAHRRCTTARLPTAEREGVEISSRQMRHMLMGGSAAVSSSGCLSPRCEKAAASGGDGIKCSLSSTLTSNARSERRRSKCSMGCSPSPGNRLRQTGKSGKI